MGAADDQRIAAALLRYLSVRLGKGALAYAESPLRISGGFDTAIFGFTLNSVDLPARLILRLGKPSSDPARFALEAAVQNALVSMGYPAPLAYLSEPSTTHLGGPFMIMQRLDGRPLAHELEQVIAAPELTSKLKGMLGLRSLFGAINSRWVDSQVQLHELPTTPLLKAIADAGLDQRAATFAGQRARLVAMIDRASLTELKPGLAWL